MSRSSTVHTRPQRKRNVCMFNIGRNCALVDCHCASLRVLFAKPAFRQVRLNRHESTNDYLEDFNASELACMAGGPD